MDTKNLHRHALAIAEALTFFEGLRRSGHFNREVVDVATSLDSAVGHALKLLGAVEKARLKSPVVNASGQRAAKALGLRPPEVDRHDDGFNNIQFDASLPGQNGQPVECLDLAPGADEERE